VAGIFYTNQTGMDRRIKKIGQKLQKTNGLCLIFLFLFAKPFRDAGDSAEKTFFV
jgi:hypothetical protein